MSLAARPVGELVRALAARTPVPGGGAAAAASAALGCAAGAMAARFTTGPKWADRAAEAEALAQGLDTLAARVLALADEDEAAFAASQAARKAGDAAAQAEADRRAAAIPLACLELCVEASGRMAAFLPRCNPNLVSDVRVGVHLAAGAGRAAWATVLANKPEGAIREHGDRLLAALRQAESAVG